jgi:hypothetical protein
MSARSLPGCPVLLMDVKRGTGSDNAYHYPALQSPLVTRPFALSGLIPLTSGQTLLVCGSTLSGASPTQITAVFSGSGTPGPGGAGTAGAACATRRASNTLAAGCTRRTLKRDPGIAPRQKSEEFLSRLDIARRSRQFCGAR